MPSGITHILLTKKLLDEIPDSTLKYILADCSAFLTIGAVAPDLPYASIADIDTFLLRQSGLADKFHYDKTNQIPFSSLDKLKSLKDTIEEEVHYQMFSFFLGYISHVVADGIFHPFIRDKVGNYAQNKAAHRSLELQLDVLYYRFVTKNSGYPLELIYTDIQKELLNYKSSPEWEKTFQIFSQLITDVYGVKDTVENIEAWTQGLDTMFTLAGGTHLEIIRKQEANSFQFKNSEDINAPRDLILTKPVDRDVNFLHIDKIDYFQDCVPMFFKKFVTIAQRAYSFIFENGSQLTEDDIPAINLDTGRLITDDNLDLIPEFWK